jgi:signal peptidase I
MRDGGQGTPEKPAKPRKKQLSPLMALLLKIAALALLLFLTLTFVMGVHIQEGNRMYPFLMDGDLLITYKLEDYRVGDVVAYRHPDTGKTEISRIVALGDNIIQVTEYGELLINGVSPAERVFYPTTPLEGENVEYPYYMRRGGYFVLDDYRTEGDDSRHFGQLLREDLLGKVVYVFRRRGI